MKSRYTLISIILIFVFTGACSIWKKDDPDKEIRVFISEFEKSLSGTDEEILKLFEAHQSKEAILSAIHLLQNKEMEHLHCTSNFQLASITHDAKGIKIEVNAVFETQNLSDTITQATSVIFWIEPSDGHFVVSKLDGRAFFNVYLSMKHQVNLALNQELELANRKIYFATAHTLQEKYDSIIWYVHYDAKTYYYAVSGTWRNYFINSDDEKPSGYAMGLVDEKGTIIIPLEYDLVGTPGIVESDIIEVKKDGLVGFYTMSGKQLIPPEYDWIIPYENNDAYALVKRDTTYGWLDKSYSFNIGFPSQEARAYMKNYEFLPGQFTLSNNDQNLAEIPTDEYIGYGIVMPPTYWTATGIFREIMPGFTKGENMYTGYREYITAEHSFVETVTNNISALITTLKERYLEGREEFYEHSQVTFINSRGDALATDDLYQGEVTFRKINDQLLEVKIVENSETVSDYDQPDNGDEWNIPMFKYYQLDNDLSVQNLTSHRRFNQTEFIKLDSSYLVGEFKFYNPETQQQDTRAFLSDMTLIEMRNEILANYGFIFKDEQVARRYSYAEWYKPSYNNYADFADQLTEIDSHNLIFLEKIIGTLDISSS